MNFGDIEDALLFVSSQPEFFNSAYGRFKNLLEDKGLLDEWYSYENSKQEKALREWCKENNIKLTG